MKACLMLSEAVCGLGASTRIRTASQFGERIDLTAFEWNLPVVATQRPLMHIRQRLKLQHTMTAIRLGAPIVEVADQVRTIQRAYTHGLSKPLATLPETLVTRITQYSGSFQFFAATAL